MSEAYKQHLSNMEAQKSALEDETTPMEDPLDMFANSAISPSYIEADRALITQLSDKNIFGALPYEIQNLVETYQMKYALNDTMPHLDPSKDCQDDGVNLLFRCVL